MLLLSAQEQHLLVLQDTLESVRIKGEPEPKACAVCCQLEELCLCPYLCGLYWPLSDVVSKLKAELANAVN